MVNWTPYLDSLCKAYTQWWQFGTLKDVVEPKWLESQASTLPFEFGLMVETVERETQQRGKEEQKVERLSVLEGLRKYAPNHVLLVGRPGSGKSTALVRLLVAMAQQALQNPHSQIPVLVELRTYNIYYKTSVLDLVQASLKRRKLRLNLETIEDELAEGRFLLLMDGINELPDDEARRSIKEFRLDYSDVPMVFTTRDLGVGGDLGIEKKLEMQSLTQAEVEKFVRECMPGGSQQTLEQLRQRLRELGQTPFVMWMLYFIVQKTGRVPSGAGSAFREFTQLYERRSKDDAPVSEESRRWWSRLLEHLGFEMMQADKPTDFRLTISKREAEDILTKVLDSEKFDKPRDYALRWLEDLLKHHLIQVTSNDQLEFCHQLIQEYYAAEILLQMLLQKPSPLSDETLKREYLNYLKWTEPLALMLELVEDEKQALRVVELALEVDLKLGARLAGAVKAEWQEKTVGLVAGLEIPQKLKILLLGVTRSDSVVPLLETHLVSNKSSIRENVIAALGQLGSEKAISLLHSALTDKNSDIRESAVEALSQIGSDTAIFVLRLALLDTYAPVSGRAVEKLCEIGSEAAISALRSAQSNPETDSYVRGKITGRLGRFVSEDMISALTQQLTNENFFVRLEAVKKLGAIGSESTIHVLCQALNDDFSLVRAEAVSALGQIGSEAVVPALCKALTDEDGQVQLDASISLGRLKSETAVPALIQTLKHTNPNVRVQASIVLGQIVSEASLPALVQALADENSKVRSFAARALGEIGSEAAVSTLLKTLTEDVAADVRSSAAEALGEIGNLIVIPTLIQSLEDIHSNVRSSAATALGKIGSSEEIIAALNQVLVKDLDDSVRWFAVESLKHIGSEAVIPTLRQALTDKDVDVRVYAIQGLGKIGSETVIPELRQALKDTDLDVRASAADAMGVIGSKAAISDLCQVLLDEDENPWVRSCAATSLGQIGSEAAISALHEASENVNSEVRYSVLDALGAIGSPLLLPPLTQKLQQSEETYLLKVIRAIQERCKFYNYTLAQPILTIATRLMHILHLSDLHFGTLDQANLWSSQLAEDLRNELDIPQLDALILSGDIANYSTPDEYNAAEQFLNKLRQQFPLTPEQIIIVPGNHDINWKQAKKAYRLERREDYDSELREGCYIDRGDIIEIRDEQDYKNRFANFSNFYQAIKGEPYPPDYEQQGILHHLTEQNLLILGLNSAWQLDHHYKTRANIHPIALSNALDQISRDRETYQNCLKIAVWHHPIHSTGEDRITDAAFLDRLAVAGFRLFLHGHVHEAKTSNYRYDMTKDGRHLDQICAGTFGAPTKELVTGTPWQYNLLQFESDKLTVRTRCRRKENGTWEPDSIWRQGKGKGAADFYRITL
jgi:HEAT repeat protein/3',5'-cyclic AMP phosphodiesterase CpdA